MLKSLFFFSLFLFLSLWAKSFAQSDLGNIYNLSEDIHNIVVEAAPLPTHYRLSTKESDRIKSIGDFEGEIAEYAFGASEAQKTQGEGDFKEAPCEELSHSETRERLLLRERIKKRKFSIYYMGIFQSSKAVSQAEGVYGSHNYQKFMDALKSRGVSGASEIDTLAKLERRFLSKDGSSEDWSQLNPLEKAKRLQEFGSSSIKKTIPLSLILSEYAIKGMIAHPAQWKENLHQIKDHLSFDEKIRIASQMGGSFQSDYNDARADDSREESNGVVTIEEMLESLSTRNSGGVCRDIALAQAQILKELGVRKDDIYILAYTATKGAHGVLAVRDPRNRNNIVKINYDYITEEGHATGGTSLQQDTEIPDFGMSFRVFNSEGKPLTKVPSEMGQILEDVTHDNERRDLLKNYSLKKVGVRTPYGQGSLFMGQTSSGDKVMGVALNRKLKGKYMGLEAGLSAVRREGERTFVTIGQSALYSRLKYKLNTPNMKVGDNFKLRGSVSTEGRLFFMSNTEKERSNGLEYSGMNIEPELNFRTGVKGSWTSDEKTTKVDSKVEVSGYVDFANIANSDEGRELVFDNIKWTTGVQKKIGKEMKLLGEGTIILNKLGATAILEGALRSEKGQWKVKGAYQAPLSDLPRFMSGSSEVVALEAQKSWKDEKGRGPTLTFEYAQDLNGRKRNANLEAGWKF